MTEQYGIDKTAVGGIYLLQQALRATGKTTRMINDLKDGDRVVTFDERHATQLRHLIRARKLDVGVVVREPHPLLLQDQLNLGTSQGRTVFDHAWIEQYYEAVIKNASILLDAAASELSGRSEAHEETRRRALRARIMDPDTTMQEAGQLQRELDKLMPQKRGYDVDPHDIADVIRSRSMG